MANSDGEFSMQDENTEDPKIIIDEDWKSQVEREKNQATQSPQEAIPSKPEDSSTASEEQEFPDANFPMLVTMLATQALVALGQLPGGEGESPKVQKPVAKHFIDLLGVLDTKTTGNLQPEEAKMLRDILHNLRMTYVNA